MHTNIHIYIKHSCMFVYVCTYIFTWKHACIHFCIPGYTLLYYILTIHTCTIYTYIFLHIYLHTDIFMCIQPICVSAFIHEYIYTDSWICVLALIHTCLYTYIHMHVHMYMKIYACLINTYRQTAMFVNKHACLHTYIIHTFQPRNIHNFRVKYFHNFHISRIFILLEVWKYNSGNREILQTW